MQRRHRRRLAHRRAAGRKGWWRPLCCCYSTVITEHSAICYRLSLSPSLPLPLSLPPSLALSLWRLGMDQASALVRSELRALCQQRPTGTPASFERPPARAAVSDPSSAVLTSADGSLKGAARSTFRRSRVRVAAALGRSTVRPQSAPARSSDDLGGSSSSGYLALKRRSGHQRTVVRAAWILRARARVAGADGHLGSRPADTRGTTRGGQRRAGTGRGRSCGTREYREYREYRECREYRVRAASAG